MTQLFAMPPAPGKSLAVLISILAIVLIPLVILMSYTAYSGRGTRYEISDRGLTVKGTLYGRTLSWADIVPQQARIVDLAANRELQPTLRTNGIGLPGYQAGWFRLRSGRGLLFVTDRSRVVAIPTTKSYTLLLSVDRPGEFVDAIRQGDVSYGSPSPAPGSE